MTENDPEVPDMPVPDFVLRGSINYEITFNAQGMQVTPIQNDMDKLVRLYGSLSLLSTMEQNMKHPKFKKQFSVNDRAGIIQARNILQKNVDALAYKFYKEEFEKNLEKLNENGTQADK